MAVSHSSKFKRKLRDEFIGWVLLLSVLITSFYGFFAYNRSKGQLDAELGQRLVSVGKLAAAQLDPGRIDLVRQYGVDYEGQRRNLNRLRNIAGVRNIYVLDRASRIIVDARGDYSVGERSLMLSLDEAEQERGWGGQVGISTLYQGSDQQYYKSAYVPLFRGESEVAYLVGVEASAAFLRAIEEFGRAMLMAAVLFIMAALVVGVFLSRYILRPVERLVRGAEQVGEGRFSVTVPEQPLNELGFLAQAFNDMTRQLKAHNDYMLESLTSGLVAVDSTREVTTVNQAATEILGCKARRLMGRDFRQGLKEFPQLVALIERALKGRAVKFREVHLAARERHLLVSSAFLKNKLGRVVGAEVILVDNTELKRLQTQVVLKERLAALGEMSAGVAHEIRNPLAAIQGFVELLQRKGKEEQADSRRKISSARPPRPRAILPKGRNGGSQRETEGHYLNEIRREIDVLDRVVNDFLDFARPSKLSLSPCRIEPVVREVAGVAMAEAAGEGAKMKIRFDKGLPRVGLDVAKFRRALLNVMLNSLQASGPGKGRVSVRCRRRRGGAGRGAAEKVVLEIRDRGPGMGKEVLAKVFHPFFTTKEKGTGLGLAIAHKIMEEHGGGIRAESGVGRGTTFYLELNAEGEK